MITMPRIRRTSQRLTWRPGVNQRTTRGFIRKGATGAPSLAQHFLNSFPARFVTSIGPYPGPRKRAYNRRRVRENDIRTQFTQPVHRAKGGRPRMAIKAEGITRAAEARKKEQAQYWVFLDGEFKRYADARLGLMTHALHYGTGVFEGIRGYWSSEHEQLFILKLREHYARLQRSVKVLKLKIPISLDELCKTSIELVRKNNFRQDVYIRPLAFKSSEEIGVRLHNLKDSFAIYVTPFGNYVDVDRGIRCMVSSWRRIDDNAAPARAKITGIYVNSALAKSEAMENGFDEAIMLTQEGHVCEGSAENIFLLRDGKAFTPPTSDNILEGLTRLGIMELLRNELDIEVVERSIDRSELYIADEIFLCGTGAQISPVIDVDRRPIGDGQVGPVVSRLQKLYFDIVRGRNSKYRSWLTPVY